MVLYKAKNSEGKKTGLSKLYELVKGWDNEKAFQQKRLCVYVRVCMQINFRNYMNKRP